MKATLLAALVALTASAAYAQSEPTEVPVRERTAQKLTEIGAVMGPYEILPGMHVSTWCMISTGALKETGATVAELAPETIPYVGIAKSIATRIIGLEKGQSQCLGQVAKTSASGWARTSELARARLALNFRTWVNGEAKTEDLHPCWGGRARCIHQARDAGQTTDAITACIEVQDKNSDAIGSVVFAVVDDEDETSPKFPEDIAVDMGARNIGCDGRKF